MTLSEPGRMSVMAIIESGPGGEPSAANMEVLGAARGLATGLGCEMAVAFVAREGDPPAVAAARQGASCAYQVTLKGGEQPSGSGMVEAAWAAIEQGQPAAVLLADSVASRTTAARLAVRMDSELVVGCALLKARDGVVQMGRACLSGKAFAQLEWNRARPVVITIAPGAFAAPRSAGSVPDAVPLDASPAAVSRVKVVGEVAPTPEGMGVTEAEVVVAGGAGVGGAEGFGVLVELARRLGGTVAASRVAVDRGWMPSSRQVGLTGKSVAPRIYLAVGISGAPQHIAGIRSAGKVVAINQDPRAPIFRVADLAVLGDLNEVIPALLQRLPAGNNGDHAGGAQR